MRILPDTQLLSSTVEFLSVDLTNLDLLPLLSALVSAGFPSPAADYEELGIHIGEFVARNPNATFFIRVKGDSMLDAHILDGSILAVDKSLRPKHNDIVVCAVDGEFTVKRLLVENNKPILQPENKKYPPLHITPDMTFQVWGVVVTVLHRLQS